MERLCVVAHPFCSAFTMTDVVSDVARSDAAMLDCAHDNAGSQGLGHASAGNSYGGVAARTSTDGQKPEAGLADIGLAGIALDAAMMERVAMGDTEAFRKLVAAHLRPLIHFSYRMLRDATEAQDVAQEALVRLWKLAPRWKPNAKVTTWLHHVARNLCIDKLRAQRTVGPQGLNNHPDPSPEAFSRIAQHQRELSVQRALDALPERQKAAIVLVYYQGMSNRDAADVMQVKVEALESLLSRARRALRATLAVDGIGDTSTLKSSTEQLPSQPTEHARTQQTERSRNVKSSTGLTTPRAVSERQVRS